MKKLLEIAPLTSKSLTKQMCAEFDVSMIVSNAAVLLLAREDRAP